MQHYKILSKYNSHDQIPGNIGKVGIWHTWGQGKCIQALGAGDPRERNHLLRLGVEGRAVLK